MGFLAVLVVVVVALFVTERARASGMDLNMDISLTFVSPWLSVGRKRPNNPTRHIPRPQTRLQMVSLRLEMETSAPCFLVPSRGGEDCPACEFERD